MMSLPLNQTNPQLNDLLLRGGSSLSPELKEQAIDDILAEFGSAPTKKAAKQAVPAQKQPASPGDRCRHRASAPNLFVGFRGLVTDIALRQIYAVGVSLAQ